jgi:hypothetical protein
MSARYSWRRCFSLLSAFACGIVTTIAAAQPPAAPAPNGAPAAAPAGAAQQQGDPRVLDQGPIHEAFAEPIALDAKARVIIDRQPPEPINELPPEVKPDGDNVEWIPGYWMWSDEQLDFVWVSGVWREIPPGRRWVPGHWLAEGNSFIWASGFWARTFSGCQGAGFGATTPSHGAQATGTPDNRIGCGCLTTTATRPPAASS